MWPMVSPGNPFVPSEPERDPVRRFRGRLAAAVTIVTAGSGPRATGLTVSSLVIVEGEPGIVRAVVGPLTDLWDAIEDTEGFVVHVATSDQHPLADVFAGRRPNPGGLFAGSSWEPSEWGPVLVDLGDRVYCRLLQMEELGYSGMVTGRIDEIELSDLVDPLVYFRGAYRRLG